MAKSSLQPVSNDVIFVHTHTKQTQAQTCMTATHTLTHTQIYAPNVSLPLAFEMHLSGMWRTPLTPLLPHPPEPDQRLVDRL